MTYSHDEIYTRLQSKDPSDRRVAAVMIGKARQYDFVGELMNLVLNDLDAGVRSMAAFALDLLGSVESIPALVRALYDHSFDVRSNAGWALVNIAKRILPQLVVPDVIDVLYDDAHPHARQIAFMVLLSIPDDMARDATNAYLDK